MKIRLLFLPFIFLFSINIFGQTFTAETLDIYIGEPKGNYFGAFKILSGVMKSGEEVAIHAETGRKFICKITKMEDKNNNPLTQAKAGKIVYVDFFTTDDASGGKDYLRKGYKIFPKNFNIAGNSNGNSKSPVPFKKAQFQATLDGKLFRANITYKGASYWRKGVKNFREEPYLQLLFGNADAIDTRNLLIQIIKPKESPAVYTEKDLEINFSGAIDGKKENTTIYGFVNGKADTKFTVEITKWQKVSATKAIISGKISGDLREILLIANGEKVNTFANSVFENVEVEIFNEQQDLDKMMKEATKKRN
jgi:hypothetical protein